MGSYLEAILAFHRARVNADARDIRLMEEAAVRSAEKDPPRPFAASLRRSEVAVIAEVKRRSPSRGELCPDLDASLLAAEYADGGAACLSVLTDSAHFGGSPDDLARARAAVTLPVLRKDFTVSLKDVFDARIMGADAVLLIAAGLNDDELRTFRAAAEGLGMAALVEVHDEHEAERAITCGARLVGVNQRDLHTFDVDGERAARVAKLLPAAAIKVAESGISSAADVARLAEAGFDAVLIGERLVTAHDRGAALRPLAAVRAGGS